MVKIGIIGGSGIYNPGTFEIEREIYPETEFGYPSDQILIGKLAGVDVAFIPRHGKEHQYNPTMVPYRANIKALKDLGVEIIISPCAVGSLRNKYKPGDIVMIDQFIDFTKKRDYTFFDDKTVHISTAEPFCEDLRNVFGDICHEQGYRYHTAGTYICIEGPRFSTKAESLLFRDYADVIGMTLVPECQLACEMGMCYCSIATVTDYDTWKGDQTVDFNMVLETMKETRDKIMKLLDEGLPRIYLKRACNCKNAAVVAGLAPAHAPESEPEKEE